MCRRQGQPGARRAVVIETRDEFPGHVLGVRGAAAIAGEQNLAALPQRRHDGRGNRFDLSREGPRLRGGGERLRRFRQFRRDEV